MDLRLYSNLNNLIDEINCAGKWFAGNNTTKQTMKKFLGYPLGRGRRARLWLARQKQKIV
jgi:hypothetical protein